MKKREIEEEKDKEENVEENMEGEKNGETTSGRKGKKENIGSNERHAKRRKIVDDEVKV